MYLFSEPKLFSSQKETMLANIKFEAVQEWLSKTDRTDHKIGQQKKFAQIVLRKGSMLQYTDQILL